MLLAESFDCVEAGHVLQNLEITVETPFRQN